MKTDISRHERGAEKMAELFGSQASAAVDALGTT